MPREYKRMDKDHRRTENVTIILTPIEFAAVREAAAAAGKPFSVFIRDILFTAINIQ